MEADPMPFEVKTYTGPIPLWVVHFQRLARMGAADYMTPPNPLVASTLVRFNLGNRSVEKFPFLQDAERIWLVYRS
jgi:hypothetical protein